jgi:metallo-beta-lactamase family protein
MMTDTIEVTFHGAAQTVTGSCMEVRWQGQRMLIDCGLFQGSRSLETLNRERFAFVPDKVHCVVLTHAHIDHSGLLPRLVAEGFAGPIWCTEPTRDLLNYMLPDAGRIQESEAERRNRRADRADEPEILPIYTEKDSVQAVDQARPIALGEWFEPLPGLRARLWNAGHILGSASVELQAGETGILFSGDLGPAHKAFHPDPDGPARLDHIICESTYGDRDRPEITMDERRRLLEAEIKAALTRGGNLVIPVFAVERTQELLLDVASLINSGQLPYTPLFIDSPLASRVTGVFARHGRELEDMGSGEIFHHSAFHYVESAAESMRLNTLSGAIIMAASGMCEAGRIRHHLLHNLPRRESTILFVGYQAQGSLGRTILEGAKRVRISGRDVAVRAQIRRIDSYSAHADRSNILAWIAARQPIGGSIFLTHGEAEAIESLRRELQGKDAAAHIVTPRLGECYTLGPAAPAKRTATGRIEAQQAVGRDWQNDYADFSVNLKRELQKIGDAAKRKEALDRMRRILNEYGAHRRNHHR